MRVLKIEAENFGSYKRLEFVFDGQGLTLISGPNGSGKSTLCDLIPWALFGRTSKDGAADEVISWGSTETTSVHITFQLGHDQYIKVMRTRAPNDLFYVVGSEVTPIRGKDLNDTQKLINARIGFDCETYLNSAYFHEFCQSAQFFTTSAKGRRLITENLVDLSLATSLQENSKDQLKTTKIDYTKTIGAYENAKGRREWLEAKVQEDAAKMSSWSGLRLSRQKNILKDIEAFEQQQVEIVTQLKQDSNDWIAHIRGHVMTGACPTCGTENTKPIKKEENPFPRRIIVEVNRINPHLKRLEDVTNETNPYLDTSTKKDAEDALFKEAQKLEQALLLQRQVTDLELLQDVIKDLRSAVIQNAVSNLETTTNKLLNDHFEAEIRVVFSVQDADKLEVELYKDGNNSAYTQLSKGQRQMLKLCFGVAVMKATANQYGLQFAQVWFDESLDGFSDETKLKAISLFETLALEHQQVFLVEHSGAVKASIDNQIQVQLVNGESVIEKA